MKTDEIGKNAALLSAVEVGLGSVLHGFSVPFAGHFLSLNQGFILTWAVRQSGDRKAAGLISTTAALLKSLSPAGKKLTPMLAIAMQGQLFGIGTLLLGTTPLGSILGMTFLCLWGFLQPLLLYGLLYGEALFKIADFFLHELSKVLPITRDEVLLILFGLIALKLILGAICVWLAYRLPRKNVERYADWAMKQPTQQSRPALNPWLGALRDLFSPLFVISWLFTLLFYVYAQGSEVATVWILLRPVAVGFLIFLTLRLLPTERLHQQLVRSHPRLAATLASALKVMGKKN